jgi:hypothetical protein
MTDDFFTVTLGIDPRRCYTLREIAVICGALGKPKTTRTVKNWVYVGMKAPEHGVVMLEKKWIGGRIAIIGADLIDFLQKVGQDGAGRGGSRKK